MIEGGVLHEELLGHKYQSRELFPDSLEMPQQPQNRDEDLS